MHRPFESDAGSGSIDPWSYRTEASIVADEVSFDAADATLLQAIDDHGSVAAASAALGRSRPWVLRRLDDLEGAFGALVERRRGGPGGGGSELTHAGRRMVARFARLTTTLEAVTRVPVTAIEGTVVGLDGDVASVRTGIGRLGAVRDGFDVDDEVYVWIGADLVTIHDPGAAPPSNRTSARNRTTGRIDRVRSDGPFPTVDVIARGTHVYALATPASTDRLGLHPGTRVVLTWKATGTRLASSG